MVSRTVKIVIDPVGQVTMEGQGFVGDECNAAMAPLEEAFAGAKANRIENKDGVLVSEGASLLTTNW